MSDPMNTVRKDAAALLDKHRWKVQVYGDGYVSPSEEAYYCSCGVTFGGVVFGQDERYADPSPEPLYADHLSAVLAEAGFLRNEDST